MSQQSLRRALLGVLRPRPLPAPGEGWGCPHWPAATWPVRRPAEGGQSRRHTPPPPTNPLRAKPRPPPPAVLGEIFQRGVLQTASGPTGHPTAWQAGTLWVRGGLHVWTRPQAPWGGDGDAAPFLDPTAHSILSPACGRGDQILAKQPRIHPKWGSQVQHEGPRSTSSGLLQSTPVGGCWHQGFSMVPTDKPQKVQE